jgi:hypothetical protein
MAVIAVVPTILNDVSLTIGTDNYEAHVSKVTFTPNSELVKWKSLTPTGTYTFPVTADWQVEMEYAQDWVTANSLSKYLMDNEGTQKVMVFKPKKPPTGTAPLWTVTVFISPGAIGGEVDAVATATVTLGAVGRPVLTVA